MLTHFPLLAGLGGDPTSSVDWAGRACCCGSSEQGWQQPRHSFGESCKFTSFPNKLDFMILVWKRL